MTTAGRFEPNRHAERRAIVTGAASGIGYATSLRLAQEGADVTACDQNEAGLAQLQIDAASASGQVATIHADISRSDDVNAIVDGARSDGPIDILANIAGIMDFFVPLDAMTDEEWDRVLAVNLTGAMRLCRRVIPTMLEAGRGAIVNMSSRAGLFGGGAGTAYVASKHGLIGLTRSVAALYAKDGIRCNAVCPGAVRTGLGTTSTPRVPEYMERWDGLMNAAVRFAEPGELAAIVSWLASDEASNVNGAIMTADAGWSVM